MSSTDDVASGDVAAGNPAAEDVSAGGVAAEYGAAEYGAATEVAVKPARRPRPRLLLGLLIAALVLVSASLGSGVTGIVAAGAAHDARVSAARELGEMQAARVVAEVKADACLAAFAFDRAALESMADSAGDLNSALRTVDESGWPAALALIASATEHLRESKQSIAQANAAHCTE